MAPPLERVIPKSILGHSIWAHVLLNKYAYQQPLYRCLKQLSDYGLSLAQGTVTEGLQKLLPLFVPVYDAIVKRSLAANHWHADETGWKVFGATEGKKDPHWYLWVLHNTETVVYKIADSRSSRVLKEHFGKKHPGGTFNVDRYGAYKSIAKSGLFILAFCWAHVRRDFLKHSKTHPEQEAWGLGWVESINALYHVNNQRIQEVPGSAAFQQHDKLLKEQLNAMQTRAQTEQQNETLLPSAKKILISLENHWKGLTVFSERPDIPMDNNTAERSLRNPVVGRKNYYGSGSEWSAELAAALFTIFETLNCWKLNRHTWVLAYLQDCTMAGGESPLNLKIFLPWEMTEKQKELFAKPPKGENSS
jgi:transposase